jgi:V/A-type H+-transporting ATPase subunit C
MERTGKIKPNKPVQIDRTRYAYATARIRAMENGLVNASRLSRYFEARSEEEIARLLVEDGYPAASDPESSLQLGLEAAYEEMRELSPDQSLIDTLLLSRDIHNLKVMLKSLAVYWPRRKPEQISRDAVAAGYSETPVIEQKDNRDESVSVLWPEIHTPVTLQQLQPLLQQPSTIPPEVMFTALRSQKTAELPPELVAAAAEASGRYLQNYDVSEIDIYLDQTQAIMFSAAAAKVENDFFRDYVSLRSDLANAGMLLRTRFLHSGVDYLARVLLPGGQIPVARLLELYEAPVEDIIAALSTTRLAGLAETVEHFAQGGEAIARFSQAQDEVLIRFVQNAKRILRGPEAIIGYLIAREMEIRTIRIIITCLRNDIPIEKARELARLTYL